MKQVFEISLSFSKLAWEPSVVQVTIKVAPVVYRHLNDFTGKLNFAIKVDSLSLKSQAKNIPVGYRLP